MSTQYDSTIMEIGHYGSRHAVARSQPPQSTLTLVRACLCRDGRNYGDNRRMACRELYCNELAEAVRGLQ